MAGNAVHKTSREACFLHPGKRSLAVRIIADSADKTDFMLEIMSVQGEVKRCSAQMFGLRENVPQYLAHAYYLQSCRCAPRQRSSLYHLQQTFTACFPIVTGEDIRPNFNEARKHLEDRDWSPGTAGACTKAALI